MITTAMQLRADACTCDPVGGLPREIVEAPNDRGRHQGDDDDDHLDAGVEGYGDRRSAARDSKRGDVVGGHHHHHDDDRAGDRGLGQRNGRSVEGGDGLRASSIVMIQQC